MEHDIRVAIEALKSTAIEMMCVMGYESAAQSGKLQSIRDMVEHLVYFWDLDSEIIEDYVDSLEKVKIDLFEEVK